MIDYKEIRVGNLVKKSGSEEFKLITVEDFWLYYTDPTRGFYYCEPIPITPEILEACGMKKDDKSPFGGWLLEIDSSGEAIRIVEENGGWHWPFNGYRHPVTNYLHQLQNLYFALTGKELIYSPIKKT